MSLDTQSWTILFGGAILVMLAVAVIIVICLFNETRHVKQQLRNYYQQCRSLRTGISPNA